MQAKYANLAKEDLLREVDGLLFRLLDVISDSISRDDCLDADDVMSVLERFAGKEYLLNEKLEHGFALDLDDKAYLSELLEKQAS